jgi:hypothetical protein
MKAARSPGQMALGFAYLIGMLALFLFSFAGSIWTIWRWRGLWRIAPMVWLAWLILMVAEILIDSSKDPTAHNLWFISIAMWALWNGVLLGALLIARKLSGSRNAP